MSSTPAANPQHVELKGGGHAHLVAYLESDLRARSEQSLFKCVKVSMF